MDRVCLRAARLGLLLGCVGAAPHVYAGPLQPAVPPTQASQSDVQQPPQVLSQLSLEGATVFSRDDVLWLLNLREGTALAHTAERSPPTCRIGTRGTAIPRRACRDAW